MKEVKSNSEETMGGDKYVYGFGSDGFTGIYLSPKYIQFSICHMYNINMYILVFIKLYLNRVIFFNKKQKQALNFLCKGSSLSDFTR